jgi:methyl-accepting chemotaxis protein
MVAAAGMCWVIGVHAGPGAQLDLPLLVSLVSAVAAVGILVGVALALWLDRGIVGQLQGLANSLASGRVSDLRGLPAAAGWGELSQITQQVQMLLTHHRQAARAAEELGIVRAQLGIMRETLDRWVETERWGTVRVKPGALAPLAETLDRGLRRLEEVRDENVQAARQIGSAVADALEDARDTASEAERGFVEATALLTTVRELQRLGGELEQALARLSAAAPGEQAEVLEGWRVATRGAIQELLESSSGSVEHLGRGLLRVQEITDQVQLVANRATLIALNAALGGAREGRPDMEMAELSQEMKQLASEVRSATERTSSLSQDVEGDVAAAIERMRGVRQRIAARLEDIPSPIAGESPGVAEPNRLVGRVKEMIEDAAQKGERLSAAGESVSRAAERLVRRLEEEVQELAGMVVRLSPPEEPPSGPNAREGRPMSEGSESSGEGPRAEDSGPRSPGLKLLDPTNVLPSDPPRINARRVAGDPQTGQKGRS